MTLVKTVFLSVLVAGAAFAGTRADNNPIDIRYDSCLTQSNGVTANMVNCTSTAITEWDNELNKNYKTLKKQFNKKQRKALRAAQRAWLKFRDSEMKLMRATAEGGTFDSIIQGSHYLEMEKQRALDLQSYIQNPKN